MKVLNSGFLKDLEEIKSKCPFISHFGKKRETIKKNKKGDDIKK